MATIRKLRNRLTIAGILLLTRENSDAKNTYDRFAKRYKTLNFNYKTFILHLKDLEEEEVLKLEIIAPQGRGKGRRIIISEINKGKLAQDVILNSQKTK